MEFKYRAVDVRPPPTSTGPGVFPDHPLHYGCSSDEGIRPVAAVEFNRMSAHPYIDREQIERENQEIRKDLLALRRRILEASLRRKLLFEREMVPRGGGSDHLGYDERSTRFLDLEYPHFDFGFMDDCWMVPQSDRPDDIPLHRPQNNLAFDLNPLPNKDRMIVLPRPDPNLSGAKRKTEVNSANIESPMAQLKKKPKCRRVCVLCDVTMTSEKVLNDHLQGKKHKLKEARVKGEKIDSGIAEDKELKEAQLIGGEMDAGLAMNKESFGNVKDKEGLCSANIDNTESPMTQLKNKPKCRRVCVLCDVTMTSEKVLNDHLQGKKHKLKEARVKGEKIDSGIAVDKELKEAQLIGGEMDAGLAMDKESFGNAKDKEGLCSANIDNTESPMAQLKKKPNCRWVCVLCDVTTTSEKVLNDHVQGKKHKLKEARVKGEKIDSGIVEDKELKEAQLIGGEMDVGLALDKQSSGNAKDKEGASHYKHEESTGPSGKVLFKLAKRKILTSRSVASGGTKDPVAGPAMNGASSKRKFEYWCEMCQVGAFSPVVYASHEKGKKHLARLHEFGKSNSTD